MTPLTQRAFHDGQQLRFPYPDGFVADCAPLYLFACGSPCIMIRTRPSEPRSTVLSIEEDAVIVAICRHTLLQLHDCLSPRS